MPSTVYNRSRTEELVADNSFDYDYYGLTEGYVGSGHISNSWQPVFDKIEDCRHRKRQDGTYPVAPVLHQTVDPQEVSTLGTWLTWRNDDGGFDTVVPSKGHYAPAFAGEMLDMLPVVSDTLWSDCAYQASTAFYTQIPTQVSLPNFVWELKELPALVTKLTGDIFKDVSGEFLNDEFGWKPLLKDLGALLNLASTVQAKLEFLRNTWGKHTRLHFSKPNILGIPAIRDEVRFGWIHGEEGAFTRYLREYRCDFRASGILYHELNDLNGMIGEVRAFTAALGLNNPIKAVWDAIPYSFLIGWVSRFSDVLTSLAAQPFTGLWQVKDVTCSTNERARIDIRFKPTYRGHIGTDLMAMSVAVKRYTRVVGFPVQPGSFNLLGLTPQQLTLLIGLLGSRS